MFNNCVDRVILISGKRGGGKGDGEQINPPQKKLPSKSPALLRLNFLCSAWTIFRLIWTVLSYKSNDPVFKTAFNTVKFIKSLSWVKWLNYGVKFSYFENLRKNLNGPTLEPKVYWHILKALYNGKKVA